VELGIRACENRGVGGWRQRGLRIGLREDCGIVRESVEIRREPALGAKKSHAIGARGVERDEQNVWRQIFWRLLLRLLLRRASQYVRSQTHETQQPTNRSHNSQPVPGKARTEDLSPAFAANDFRDGDSIAAR
jgi:hypothetical protein